MNERNVPTPDKMLSKDALQALALSLDTILNGEGKPSVIQLNQTPKRLNGFVLVVFPFGDKNGKCHYVSNGASREDIIKLFREQLRQLEAIEEQDLAPPEASE